MSYEELKKKKLPELQAMAKERGVKSVNVYRKGQLIELLLSMLDEEGGKSETPAEEKKPESVKSTENTEIAESAESAKDAENTQSVESGANTNKIYRPYVRRNERTYAPDSKRTFGDRTYSEKSYGERTFGEKNEKTFNEEKYERKERVIVPPASGVEYSDPVRHTNLKSGVLEIMADGYGFLRSDNYQSGENDVYVSSMHIRRFNLKTGDYIVGNTRMQHEGERFEALLYVQTVNGDKVDVSIRRKAFDDLTPIYPNERLRLAMGEKDYAMRMIDLIAPIGKGQRGIIVSPPKAGKTTLLKNIANSITHANPEVKLIMLLIDERPEEVTDLKRSVDGDVIYSTFDEEPQNHTKVAEIVLERAKRLVEHKCDVVILLDSLTRLARAYNQTIAPSGRTLSGGLDPSALYRPKRFFGAARNIEEGGSLTILATALIETGSRMDDVIFEEFKGTGNMEIHLDRKLQERRIFPAVDIAKSSTRREEDLLTNDELRAVWSIRRTLSSQYASDATEKILGLLTRTKNNEEFIRIVGKEL